MYINELCLDYNVAAPLPSPRAPSFRRSSRRPPSPRAAPPRVSAMWRFLRKKRHIATPHGRPIWGRQVGGPFGEHAWFQFARGCMRGWSSSYAILSTSVVLSYTRSRYIASNTPHDALTMPREGFWFDGIF